jgi:hypothetical protein
MNKQQLLAELDCTPGLLGALESLAKTGMCGINPPIIGAMVRLGLLKDRTISPRSLAREAVKLFYTEEEQGDD